MAMDAENWATINGAHVKLNDKGQPQGAVGKKIQQNHEQALARRSIARHRVKMIKEALKQCKGDTTKAALQCYAQNYQGKVSKREINGRQIEVKYISANSIDFQMGMNNKQKVFFVPFIGDVIETGQYLGRGETAHPKTANKYPLMYYFKKEIDIPGIGKKNIIVDVGEQPDGTFEYRFYCSKAEVESSYRRKERAVAMSIRKFRNKFGHDNKKGLIADTFRCYGKASEKMGWSDLQAQMSNDPKEINNNEMVVNLFFEDELNIGGELDG